MIIVLYRYYISKISFLITYFPPCAYHIYLESSILTSDIPPTCGFPVFLASVPSSPLSAWIIFCTDMPTASCLLFSASDWCLSVLKHLQCVSGQYLKQKKPKNYE